METTARSTFPSNFGSSNNPESALNKASSSAHAAVDSFAEKADQAASKAKPVIERVAAKAHQAVDKAVGTAGPAADWLAAKGEDLNAAQKKLVENSSNFVSAHPLKSVGMALALGFLISRILR
jgi:ElaB/YqjD/DUF883 family membrane-anchored ribosome-binding protein